MKDTTNTWTPEDPDAWKGEVTPISQALQARVMAEFRKELAGLEVYGHACRQARAATEMARAEAAFSRAVRQALDSAVRRALSEWTS